MRQIFGLSISFLIGYAVARWFGDAVQTILKTAYREIGDILDDWV